MKKKTGKQYAPEITKRYLLIMNEVINEGICNTQIEFARSVEEHQQNFSMMDNGQRYPTLDLIARTCLKYNYNPTWLILGLGDKKMVIRDKKNIDERVADLEADVARLKRMIKK